jgi:uncharacterized protein (DUF433 family)
MKSLARKIYRGIDPGDLPAYGVDEVANYLRVPYVTLYSWLRPIPARTNSGKIKPPIIGRPENGSKLSFLNIIEAFVVRALTAHHSVRPEEIRGAIDYAERKLGISRLLIHPDLRAGARQVFLKKVDELINLGRGGQLAMERMLSIYLERIDYSNALPVRLYPFVDTSDAKTISISPLVAFGKPVVASSGILTRAISQRYEFGEEKSTLAADYCLSEEEVEAAIIYESAA